MLKNLMVAITLGSIAVAVNATGIDAPGAPVLEPIFKCTIVGETYMWAAKYRDQNFDPNLTLGWIRAQASDLDKKPLFTDSFYKEVVNKVYFDPGYVNARGKAFSKQMRDICMGRHWDPV